jgi:hypothetical protein
LIKKIELKKDDFINCQVCSDKQNYSDGLKNKNIIQQDGL